MASLQNEIVLEAGVDEVWDALRDFGAVHERVARGFVVACTLEADARVVTFANGNVAREMLVDIDDARRRLVYAISNERVTHYNAALVVRPLDKRRSRITWTIDLSPNALAPYITAQMNAAAQAVKTTLENAS